VGRKGDEATQRTKTGRPLRMQSRVRRSIEGHRLVWMSTAPRSGTNVYFQRRAGAASSICCRVVCLIRKIWNVAWRRHCARVTTTSRRKGRAHADYEGCMQFQPCGNASLDDRYSCWLVCYHRCSWPMAVERCLEGRTSRKTYDIRRG
jgi:hypothetical protein